MARKSTIKRTPSENVKRLFATKIPRNFIVKQNGQWDHGAWTEFIDDVRSRGYDPVDEAEIGCRLEAKREQMVAKNELSA